MTLRGLFRFVLITLAGLVLVYIAATWLSLTEPWYDSMLVQRMRTGSHSLPWREDTERIADVIPDGMAATAAANLLRRNGFACTRQEPSDGSGAQLQCMRQTNVLICTGMYSITIFLSAADVVTSRTAHSYRGCL